MIASQRQPSGHVITARPNRSASWQTNQQVVLALGLLMTPSAVFFTVIGAWPILPFAGLELAALAGSLYYVNWKLHYRQVIILEAEQVRIENGHFSPVTRIALARPRTQLTITPARHPWDGPRLALHDSNSAITVGDFLNRDDSLLLLQLLREELPVSTFSPAGKRRF